MVMTWLYFSGVRKVFSGMASCVRISSASTPPRMKKTRTVQR
jgi:hypothetical protein